MAMPDLAEAFVKSRGPTTRQQLDARMTKTDVWDAEVDIEFNSDKVVDLPPSCWDLTISAHFH